MKDLKYLISYTIPATAVIGLLLRGNWSFLTPAVAFILVPVLELLLPVNAKNLTKSQSESKAVNRFFDLLLYLNIPIVFGILVWFFLVYSSEMLSTPEITGLLISTGIVVGSNGINVAHELGHRKGQWEKTLGKLLLLPALYMHFYVEHNFGHHQHAATPADPASAKYNQSVYSFWFTSMTRQYIKAWRIQSQLLKRAGQSYFSIYNDMLWYTVIQVGYLAAIFFVFGKATVLIALAVALIAAILLESINYIEHYGLRRNKTASGRYERVTEIHSWNSNHVLGRVMLYELTRHSDHHYKAHKKYQVLEYHAVSPEMPYGYPTSMVISLIPPLWFSIMNKRIPEEMKS